MDIKLMRKNQGTKLHVWYDSCSGMSFPFPQDILGQVTWLEDPLGS